MDLAYDGEYGSDDDNWCFGGDNGQNSPEEPRMTRAIPQQSRPTQSQYSQPTPQGPANIHPQSQLGRGRGISIACQPVRLPGIGRGVPVNQQTMNPPQNSSQITKPAPTGNIGRGLDFSSNKAQCVKGAVRSVRPQKPKEPEFKPPESHKGSASAPYKPSVQDIKRNSPSVNEEWVKSLLAKEEMDGFKKSKEKWARDSNSWLDMLERCWAEKKDKNRLQPVLLKCFESVSNPYGTALHLTQNAKDYKPPKTASLSYTVLKWFCQWADDEYRESQKLQYLDSDLQQYAVFVAMGMHWSIVDFVITSYRVDQGDTEHLLPVVKFYKDKRMYKEAAQLAAKFQLQHHFDIKEICLPLIAQDKVNLVESYVFRKHNQQVALLQLLDQMIDKDVNLTYFIQSVGIEGINWSKMTKKIITKLAIRLLKLYQVRQDVCPNIISERTLRGLRYLLYKKYIEQTVLPEQWDDLVLSSSLTSSDMQLQLIEQLVDYLDIEEAARWARHFNLPPESLPIQVNSLLETDPDLPPIGRPDIPSGMNLDDYHTLSLPLSTICIVDTVDKYRACLDRLTRRGAIIGIDAEWRPGFGQTTVSRMALLQLAVQDVIYLLDMLCLNDQLAPNDWTDFAQQVLANDEVIKLGYGLETDLRMLHKDYPMMHDGMQHMQRVVDLQLMHQHISRALPEVFDNDVEEVVEELSDSEDEDGERNIRVVKNEERGLSNLVRQCLGKPLNKAQQMSDWERRPLREAQIYYAALDAYCLLEVYDVLKSKVIKHKLDVPLEPACGRVIKARKSKQEKRRQNVAERSSVPEEGKVYMPPNPPPVEGEPISASEFKVVVDNMLQGLGRQLRCCGVDVVILENKDPHDKCAMIARKDNRVILTSGTPYATLRSVAPEGMCFNVKCAKSKAQATEVLNHYNVQVTQADIFSRCQVCNGNCYAHVQPSDMKKAFQIYKERYGSESLMESHPSKRETKLTSSYPSGVIGKKLNCDSSSDNVNTKSSASETVYTKADFIKTADDCSVDDFDKVNFENLTVGDDVRIQIETVPEKVCDQVELFFVCGKCGKVFWEGSHFSRVCKEFSHVLSPSKAGDNKVIEDQDDDLEIVFEG